MAYFKDGKKLPYSEWTEEERAKHREYGKNYKKKNPEKVKQYYLRKRENNLESLRESARRSAMKKRRENPVRERLTSLREKSRRRGIVFNIVEDDILLTDTCPILGIPIRFNIGAKVAQPDSISIDRIRPELGYVKGNVQVISNRANAMKNDATPEELRMFARWVLKTFPEEPDAQT